MGALHHSAEFPARLDQVWELFVDPDRWLQWNTEWNRPWTAIRDVKGPFDHPGAGYTTVMRLGWRELTGSWRVVACEPRRWRRVEGRLPFGAPFRGSDRFEEEGGVTIVTLEIDWKTPWGILGRLLEAFAQPWLRGQLRRNAAAARRLLGLGG